MLNRPPKRVRPSPQYLKIGEVARMVGMSATMLRSWERLGLIHPVRTESSYRLYTYDDAVSYTHLTLPTICSV